MPRKKITKTEEEIKEVKPLGKEYTHAVGRRREAVARVRLYDSKNEISWDDEKIKKGEIFVNKQAIEKYFKGEVARARYEEPLRATNTLGKYLLTIKVEGGGPNGQLDAVVLGISRALAKHDREKFHSILRKKGLLTRDARVRERRKIGMGGKARRKRQSPKR